MERTRRQFIVRWIVATIIGGAIGPVVVIAVKTIWGPSTGGNVEPIVSAALIGFLIGLVQCWIMLKGKVSWQWWVASSAVAFAVWGLVAYSDFLRPPLVYYDDYINAQSSAEIAGDKIPVAIISFLLMGIAAGLPQWLVLLPRFRQAYRWLLGTAGSALALLIFWTISDFAAYNSIGLFDLSIVLFPITFTSITGYVLFDVLKRAKMA